MKGMYWVWVAALLMGLGIVLFTNYASVGQLQPAFAIQETAPSAVDEPPETEK